MARADSAELRELGVHDVDQLVNEVDALRWYLTSGDKDERRDASEAVRKLAYAYPDVAANLEPTLHQVVGEQRATETFRNNIEKAQVYLGVAKDKTDTTDLHHIAVNDVDQLPGQLETIRSQLTANTEDKQRTASEAARKLAYSYPDWAADLRSELQQLQRDYRYGHTINENAWKAESYIDERATGSKQSLSTIRGVSASDTGAAGGTASGSIAETDVDTDTDAGNTEVYAPDSTRDTAVYTEDSKSDQGSTTSFESNFCPSCGADISSLDGGSFCPQCGSTLPT